MKTFTKQAENFFRSYQKHHLEMSYGRLSLSVCVQILNIEKDKTRGSSAGDYNVMGHIMLKQFFKMVTLCFGLCPC